MIILNKEQHTRKLERMQKLMRQTDKLASEIEEYENRNFNIENPTALEAILFRMEQENLRQSDVVDLFGSKSKTSEVLNGKIKLTLSMMKRINKRFEIPFEILMIN